MENLENLLSFTDVQYSVVSHFLTFGFGAMAVGLLYFLTTRQNVMPKYQPAAILSSIVMVSALLILINQAISWAQAFTWNGEMWVSSNSTFSNGYRYVNWSIDVPVLFTQLLVVLGITGSKLKKLWGKFTVGALLMIWTGYIGQFYETSDISTLMIWGAISTVFMIYIVYIFAMQVFTNISNFSEQAASKLRVIWWVTICSWTLYPLAYGVPAVWDDAWGAVTRQVMYTLADVTSKVVYGILISQLAQILSKEQGYEASLKRPII